MSTAERALAIIGCVFVLAAIAVCAVALLPPKAEDWIKRQVIRKEKT